VFNPLEHPGLPVDRHGRHWHELDVEPLDRLDTDPYTRSGISAMNGLEAAASQFDWRLTWRCPDTDARRQVGSLGESASARRSNLAALQPPASDRLENAMLRERTALDLVTWAARSEPDVGLARAYEAQALRHLDRLYRYADRCDLAGHRWASRIVSGLSDLTSAPVTAAAAQRRARRAPAAAPSPRLQSVSLVHRWAVGAVQRATERYPDARPGTRAPTRRPAPDASSRAHPGHGGYRDAAPDSWEQLVVHESAACYLYYTFLAQESDPQVKAMWELHLQMELAHLHAAADLLRRSRGRDPQEVVGDGLPEPVTFDRNGRFLQALLFTDVGSDDDDAEREHDGDPAGDQRRGRHGNQPDGDRDLVDLLTAQHARIDGEFRRVANASADDRHSALLTLARLIAVHEVIEEEVVHPLARRLDPDGHLADRLLDEENLISEALTVAIRADSARPDGDGDGMLGGLRAMVRAHASAEERYEFARLKADVPAAELRAMAGAVDAAEDAAGDADPAGQPDELTSLPLTADRVRDALRAFSHDVLV
jgi:hypothetical protein